MFDEVLAINLQAWWKDAYCIEELW